MALVKTDHTILEIHGQLGGVYFKKDSSGQHVQRMPRNVRYQRSPAQLGEWGEGSPFGASGTKGYTGAAAFWLMALLAYFTLLWAGFAIAHYFTTKKGERKKITGFNWYIHYALAYPEMDRMPFWKPPHSPGELPQLICVYQGTWTYGHAPPDWPFYSPAEYYWFRGFVGDRPYFAADNDQWFLWFSEGRWVLGKILGIEAPETTFYSPDELIFDRYYNPVQNKYARLYQGGGGFPD